MGSFGELRQGEWKRLKEHELQQDSQEPTIHAKRRFIDYESAALTVELWARKPSI